MPPKRPLTATEECPTCTLAAGSSVAMGKGSTSCLVCKTWHERPPPMPNKRNAPGRAPEDATQALEAEKSSQAPTKMTQQQYATMMLWLSKDENRNIVTGWRSSSSTFSHSLFALSQTCTGAAGSATNGGARFNGSKKVVPKTQGFAMMAAQINKDHPGSGWTADTCSKKFLYLQGKYGAAKTASYRSDWGLSIDELSKGVTIPQKLEGLCKEFSVWDRYSILE
jgi:hypothetical protein